MHEHELTLDNDPVSHYNRILDHAKCLPDLISGVAQFAWCASDALKIVESMSDLEFMEFKKGLKLERKNVYAGDQWADKYMVISMPEDMFKTSCISEEFKVPWSVAWYRYKELVKSKKKPGDKKCLKTKAP